MEELSILASWKIKFKGVLTNSNNWVHFVIPIQSKLEYLYLSRLSLIVECVVITGCSTVL